MNETGMIASTPVLESPFAHLTRIGPNELLSAILLGLPLPCKNIRKSHFCRFVAHNSKDTFSRFWTLGWDTRYPQSDHGTLLHHFKSEPFEVFGLRDGWDDRMVRSLGEESDSPQRPMRVNGRRQN